MKHPITLISLVLLCFLESSLIGQSILDIGIFNAPVNSNKLEVRIRPSQAVNSSVYSAGIFTVRVPVASGVSLTAPVVLNTPLYGYALQDQGSDGTFNYFIFGFVSLYTVNWNAGTAYTAAILQFNSSCGGTATFEIINNTWTAERNGNYYQELNSLEAQNIIWQATASAPLSSGPPNISCSGDKSVYTNNLCAYTHPGIDWNASGSASCPGSSINYALTGATSGNFGSLAGVAFNAGLTTVTATITDNSSQTASCAFTVTVADAQAPTITAPAPVTATANAAACSASGVALGAPLTADNCAVASVTNNAPGSYPFGSTTVTWTVTDGAGNKATATQIVNVQSGIVASGVLLDDPQVCTGASTNLSFAIAGGQSPYAIVYSDGSGNSTVGNYTNGQTIPVSPAANTTYQLLQITDASGCSISPSGMAATLVVQPYPIIAHVLPPTVSVCAGAPVSFFADGLLPNAATTLNYTVNGSPTTATATTDAGGNVTFPAAVYAAGINNIVVTSITVNGCTSPANLGTSFEINGQSAACNLTVKGKVATEGMVNLEEVSVNIMGAGPGIPAYSLNNTVGNAYSFIKVIPPTSNLTIRPFKDNNPLNGVSTYDLVLISRHILGLDTLESLYKLIAADATNSGSITTFDIVELRKLILGVYQKLPNITSWRFINASHVFPNPTNPFTALLPETRTITNILTDHLQEDFVAVKVGDVNDSAIANANAPAEDRATGSLAFEVEDRIVRANEIFTVRFRAAEQVQGYQFTMRLQDLEVVHVQPGPAMQLAHFGIFEDAITTSFEEERIGEFEVTFRALTDGPLSHKIGVSSHITKAEAYGKSNDKWDVVFRFHHDALHNAVDAGFELYQNQPNPFADRTYLPFYLPVAAETTLTVFDQMGRIVLQRSATLSKGYNAFEIESAELPATGTFYYKIATATDAGVRKMVYTF